MSNPLDLGLDGITLKQPSDTAAQYNGTAKKMQLDGITFNERYMVVVRGVPVSSPLPSKMLAEQFLARLPVDQQNEAQIVPATDSGQQLLLG